MVEAEAATVQKVMEKVEQFYFGDEAGCGEAMFNEFAAQHSEKFEEGCDAEDMENKLE